MAHVLLPCDVPTWPEVQRHLGQLKFAHSPEQLVADMQRIYDLCCVGLDPEELPREEIRLDLLKKFLKSLRPEESRRFFEATLPALISAALKLKQLRPHAGFLYCLQQQEGMFALERPFLASLLANCFFSTFPKRNPRTHPTLQDFNLSELFPFLSMSCQCEKLRRLFAYFDCTFRDEPDGAVYFCRQVTPIRDLMSLPEWMCSDCPLCPLMVRTRGLVEEAEPILVKSYPCHPSIGGDVLRGSYTMECSMFLDAPELLAALIFVECLEDNESLTVDGLLAFDPRPQASGEPALGPFESSVCLLDFKSYASNPVAQYEDSSLLRELNKCLVTFRQSVSRRRPSPVGRSSSSSAAGLEPYYQSLSSSKTSSSRNSLYTTDSADQQSDDLFVDCKAPMVNTKSATSPTKTRAKNDDTSKPSCAQKSPNTQKPSLVSILGALKKTADALPVTEPAAAAETTPSVQSSRKPISKHETSKKVISEEGSSTPRNVAKRVATTGPKPGASRPPPALRKGQRSMSSTSSKGSFDKTRSFERIMGGRMMQPPSSSAPMLTQAVLCAQRHPSPRPERRGSGASGGMVFRPVTMSPVLSRKMAFRPTADQPIGDKGKDCSVGMTAIALPHCTFSALKSGGSEERKGLMEPPVSSPRVHNSVESSLGEDVCWRMESLEESPCSELPDLVVPAQKLEHATSQCSFESVASSCAEMERRRSGSGASTPFGSPKERLQLPRLLSQKSGEEDYHTADESLGDSPGGEEGPSLKTRTRCLKSRRERSFGTQRSGSSVLSSRHMSREDSASSAGFVLDYRSDDDDYLFSFLSKHERYEDFRRRIKRRSRRLTRRLSRGLRGSYSSGSSDMDDIHEDPELGFSPRMLGPIRAANSEPTLCGRGTGALSGTQDLPALSIAAELVVTSSPGRRQTLVMTTGRGRPKAYSFDGVNPNLPVPFKAKFRYRKTSEESSNPESLGMTRQDAEFIKSCAHPPVSPDLSEISNDGDSPEEGVPEMKREESADILASERPPSSTSSEEDGAVPSQCSELLQQSRAGIRPIATCRWSRENTERTGDAQLEAVIQWIAASIARVPCLVVYTGGEPRLEQLAKVGFKVEERRWTVGDLACETLRFCRNRVALHEGRNRDKLCPGLTLFTQLLGQAGPGTFQSHDSLE